MMNKDGTTKIKQGSQILFSSVARPIIFFVELAERKLFLLESKYSGVRFAIVYNVIRFAIDYSFLS